MRQTIGKVTQIFKGISTLDVIKGVSTLDIVKGLILLFIIITALVIAVRGGHSILDRPDPSFVPQIQTLAAMCKSVNKIIPLPDGKMLVAGQFNSFDGETVGGLVRVNADGTLDPAFNTDYPSDSVKNMILQPDGKVVVDVAHPTISGLFRLNPDGSLDTTFNAPGAGGLWAIDASGRIIVGAGSFGLRRLQSNGSSDPTFNFSGVGNVFQVNDVTTQNNKIIYAFFGGNPFGAYILRVNENGTIDTSFNQRNFAVKSMLVQPDGKILVLHTNSLRRLNADGSDDTGFTITTFPSQQPFQRTMGLSADGKITVAVYPGSGSTFNIRRFLSDGTADSSFTPYLAARFNTLAVQADGMVLLGDGSGACFDVPLSNDFKRLLPNGSPDATFNTGYGFQVFGPSSVGAIHVQPDGKILIGGSFHLVNDVPRYKIARMNPDSTLDTSFQISLGGTANYFQDIGSVNTFHTRSDGKIVMSGSFSYRVNGEFRMNLVLLNSDGSIDPTFIPVSVNSNRFKIFNDDKLLVANSRGSGTFPVPVKLLANGLRDTTFNPNLYPQATSLYANDVTIQPDGKIIVGGRLSVNINNTEINGSFLTRLNDDGSLDTTFQLREQPDKVIVNFVLQPNGKIVIAETAYPGVDPTQTSILRLNADGSIDPTFNAGTGANGKVNAMLLLPTGRIFVGGKFTTFNGQPRGNLVQINSDGSVFTPVYNLNDEVFALALDSEGRVLVGGNFTIIIAGNTSAPRSYIAALIDSTASATRFDFTGDGRADLGVYAAAGGMWSILNSFNSQTVSTNFGLSEDKTVAADFDGDLKTDYAVFRPSNGTWYVKDSTNQNPNAFREVRWGADGDKPIAGDFDGDGKADFAVWRYSTGDWWILKSSNGEALVVRFGLTGDLPLSYADFNGDRKTDIAVWRPSDGNFYWLASGSNNQFNAVHFGQNGDIPTPADYNGDGKTDLVVYRPSEGNWYQYLTTQNGEYTFSVTNFGLNGDKPVPADYDGDGKTDIAIRRQTEWHFLMSNQGYVIANFGDATAQAVAAMSAQ